MAKAAKSRKSGKGARKTSAKAKPRKAPKKAIKTAIKKSVKASARKPAAVSKTNRTSGKGGKDRKGGLKPALAAHTQSIKAGAPTAVLARPERAAPRGAPALVEQQPAESETPPALPVPIASFTF